VARAAERMIQPRKSILLVERFGLRHVGKRLEVHPRVTGPAGALQALGEDFLTEAHAFPAKHDDIVDCLSLLGRMLAGMYAPGLAIPEVQREPDDYRTWGEDPDVENSWRVQ